MAALTMASTGCCVRSPWTTSMLVSPTWAEVTLLSVSGGDGRYSARVLHWLFALLLLVDLGPSFQNASAFGEPATGDRLTLDIQVEVAGEATVVVAHLIDPGDDQQTVSLIRRGGRFYGGQAAGERANLVVIFEVIRPDGTSELSQGTTLVDMGVDPALLSGGSTTVTTIVDEEGSGPLGLPTWTWLLVAGVAAVLSAIAFWAMGDYRKSRPTHRES